MDYKKQTVNGSVSIWYEQNGIRYSFVDPSPGNTDWEEYQQWVAAGNSPEIIEQ